MEERDTRFSRVGREVAAVERRRAATVVSVAIATTLLVMAVRDFFRGELLVAGFELAAAAVSSLGAVPTRSEPLRKVLRWVGPLVVFGLFVLGFVTQDVLGAGVMWIFLVPGVTFHLYGSRLGALFVVPYLVLLALWLWSPDSMTLELVPPEYRNRAFLTLALLFLLSALLERSRERKTRELLEAVERVQRLEGMLPICAQCKKIRDDQGYWEQVEAYVGRRAEVVFTHGLCPDCVPMFDARESFNSERASSS